MSPHHFRKLTPKSLALWAALPMAQTSQIEGRLKMILDTTRSRHTLTRRTRVTAVILAFVTLVPLAMLRPTAQAQANFGMSQTQQSHIIMVSFSGVTDADKPHSPWWAASGAPLPMPIYETNLYPVKRSLVQQATNIPMKRRLFAIRLPADLEAATVKYKLSNAIDSSSAGSWLSKVDHREHDTEAQSNGETAGARILTASFPTPAAQTTIQVGIASGPWHRAAGQTRSTHSSVPPSNATFIFGPITQEEGNIWGLTVTMNASAEDVRFVAVDEKGRVKMPCTADDTTASGLEQITARFAQPISTIKEFQIQTRPFHWTEFKNVALQPTK